MKHKCFMHMPIYTITVTLSEYNKYITANKLFNYNYMVNFNTKEPLAHLVLLLILYTNDPGSSRPGPFAFIILGKLLYFIGHEYFRYIYFHLSF